MFTRLKPGENEIETGRERERSDVKRIREEKNDSVAAQFQTIAPINKRQSVHTEPRPIVLRSLTIHDLRFTIDQYGCPAERHLLHSVVP